MRYVACAMLLCVGAMGSSVAADGPFQYKPIDTNKYLVQPTVQATGFLSGLSQSMSRLTASTIDQNGYIRTLNNLFGTKQQPDPSQPNGLPAPSLYPSTQYPNSFQPRMPTVQQYRR